MMNPVFSFFRDNMRHSERFLYSKNYPRIKTYHGYPPIALPKPGTIDQSFSDLVMSRRSVWDFDETTYNLQDLSTMLYWSAAELGERPDGQGIMSTEKVFRPHPSAGHKYPIEVYICITGDEGELTRGIYHYRPDEHIIEPVRYLSKEDVTRIKSAYNYSFLDTVPVLLMFTFSTGRGMFRYGSLSYLVGIIESGHLGQNVLLTAAAAGWSTNPVIAAYPETVNPFLKIDGHHECVFYNIALGKKHN